MFTITRHKGFWMRFESGFQISVQWGPDNYCDNRDDDFGTPAASLRYESRNAEIAVFDADDNMLWLKDYDSVIGYLKTDQVLLWMARCADGSVIDFTFPAPVYDEDE